MIELRRFARGLLLKSTPRATPAPAPAPAPPVKRTSELGYDAGAIVGTALPDDDDDGGCGCGGGS